MPRAYSLSLNWNRLQPCLQARDVAYSDAAGSHVKFIATDVTGQSFYKKVHTVTRNAPLRRVPRLAVSADAQLAQIEEAMGSAQVGDRHRLWVRCPLVTKVYRVSV